MEDKKVLLLNPPAKISYSRDYFCSKVNKSGYIEHPVDLLILSGILSAEYEVEILDALVGKLSFKDCLEKIKGLRPDAIIFISGSASWIEDSVLMGEIKSRFQNLKMVGLGDILRDKEIMKHNEWLDALLLDFTTTDILNYLKGNVKEVKNMIIKNNGEIISAPARKYTGEEFKVPVPRHELFLNKKYSFPFAKNLPFTTLLTDYGCPFNCSFCIYSALGFKVRKLENVFEELEYIHHLGIKELFVKDQTFGYNRERAFNLCEEMLRRKWKFGWTAFCRADIADVELLSLMKKAGCHTLICGVETANERLLDKYKEGLTRKKIEYAFNLCRKLNIRTVGTFMIGFPYESKESVLKTIDFAMKLRCNFASFNVFIPKPGTDLYKGFYRNNQYSNQKWDQSGISSISGNGVISKEDMAALLSFAIRKFYFRPDYIIRQIFGLASLNQVRMLIANGIGLAKNFMRIS